MSPLDYFETQYLPERFLKPATIYSYRLACRECGVKNMEHLSARSIATYGKRLLDEGIAPHTAKARCEILCVLWRHAAARAMSPAFDRPQTPKCPPKIVRAIPDATLTALISHCEHLHGRLKRTTVPRAHYWSAFVAATYETALRTSDVRQLRWEPTGRWHLVQIKTGRPVTVGVKPRTLDLLGRLSKSSPNLLDMGWNREWYCRGLQRIAKHLGIRVCPQELRQSAASEQERLAPGTAWQLLGHSSPSTTQRWYIDQSHAYGDLPRPEIPWKD